VSLVITSSSLGAAIGIGRSAGGEDVIHRILDIGKSVFKVAVELALGFRGYFTGG
jgi:hypothetical protein